MRAFVPVHDVGSRDARTDRHSGPESLRQTNDVGLDAFVMIEREHLTRASHSTLNFIDDKHDSVLVADAAELFNERFRSGYVSAFALNDLEHDTGDFFRRRRCQE